jgi:hypothetical protein
MKITQRARRTAIALVAAAAIGGSGAAVGAAATAPTPPRSWRARHCWPRRGRWSRGHRWRPNRQGARYQARALAWYRAGAEQSVESHGGGSN